MSKNRRTPQEKKILSYLKDRRGSYAKNQKTGRNAVRKHKAHVSRSYRRSTTQLLNSGNVSDISDAVTSVKRKNWRKRSDPLLLRYLDSVWAGSSRTKHKNTYSESKLREQAKRKLNRQRGWT